MASPEREKFIVESFRLSRSAPQVWREWETAFRAYVQSKVIDAVKAPTDNALTAHGVAQAYLALQDDFGKLETLYQAIEKKHKQT